MTVGQLRADLNRMDYKASMLLEMKVASLEELSKHPSTAEATSGTFQVLLQCFLMVAMITVS